MPGLPPDDRENEEPTQDPGENERLGHREEQACHKGDLREREAMCLAARLQVDGNQLRGGERHEEHDERQLGVIAGEGAKASQLGRPRDDRKGRQPKAEQHESRRRNPGIAPVLHVTPCPLVAPRPGVKGNRVANR